MQDLMNGAKLGDWVTPDGWTTGSLLTEGDAGDESFAGSRFRVRSSRLDLSMAVNVTVTSRKVRFDTPSHRAGVRVRIEFVQDGEPSVFSSGWLYRPEN